MPFSQHDVAVNKDRSSYVSLIAGVFVIIIIAMLVMLSSAGIQFRRDTQLFENILAQQSIARQMLNDITAISENRPEGFSSLRMHSEQFGQLLLTIRDDVTRNGVANHSDMMHELRAVEEVWQGYRVSVNAVLAGEQSSNTLIAMLDIIQASMPRILALSEEIVRILIEVNAAPHDVYAAAQQMALIQRIANGITDVSRARKVVDEERLQVFSVIGRDSAIFEQSLQRMIAMDLGNSGVREKTHEISLHYQDISDSVEKILGLESQLAGLNFVIRDIEKINPRFIQASESLTNIYSDTGQQRSVSTIVWSMLLVGLLILLSLIVIQSKSVSRQRSNNPHEITPQDLINFMSEAVKDMEAGNIRGKDTSHDRLPPVYSEGMNDVLEPVRRRAVFVDHAITRVLSVAREMQQSVVNIVDASDRLAQQANRASSITENIVVAMRRAANDVASSMSMLNSMAADARAHHEPAHNKMIGENIEQLGGRIIDVRSAVINLSNSAPNINSVAKRIGNAASKINLMALNTAVLAGDNEEATGDLFAADEIQQYAQRIAGMTRHLTELGDVINTIIASVLAQIESITQKIEVARSPDKGEVPASKQPGENNMKLIERLRNVMAIVEHQFNAASDASAGLGSIQETIVGLSADVNDIMIRVEELEKLSGELRISR